MGSARDVIDFVVAYMDRAIMLGCDAFAERLEQLAAAASTTPAPVTRARSGGGQSGSVRFPEPMKEQPSGKSVAGRSMRK